LGGRGGGGIETFGGPLKKCFRKANIFPENFGKGVKEREVDGFFLKQNVQKFFQTLVGYNGGGGEGGGVKNMFSNFFLPQFFRKFLII
jgi:hypothetical protein